MKLTKILILAISIVAIQSCHRDGPENSKPPKSEVKRLIEYGAYLYDTLLIEVNNPYAKGALVIVPSVKRILPQMDSQYFLEMDEKDPFYTGSYTDVGSFRNGDLLFGVIEQTKYYSSIVDALKQNTETIMDQLTERYQYSYPWLEAAYFRKGMTITADVSVAGKEPGENLLSLFSLCAVGRQHFLSPNGFTPDLEKRFTFDNKDISGYASSTYDTFIQVNAEDYFNYGCYLTYTHGCHDGYVLKPNIPEVDLSGSTVYHVSMPITAIKYTDYYIDKIQNNIEAPSLKEVEITLDGRSSESILPEGLKCFL
ncbi:MAG: hypothetical protein MJZ09_01300 [Bacteroidales bacterium]|nr:hypothetical protein [Bacteroidales bacterium]